MIFVQGDKTMIQIIDASQQVKEIETQNDNDFLKMINATVSHELRNPLSSILCQSQTLEEFQHELQLICNQVQKHEPIKSKLDYISQNIDTCIKKLRSSTKFADFFIHDILDFTIMKEDNKNFQKHLEIFDIRDAVMQILEMMEDKIKLKNIKVSTKYRGF